MKPLALLFLAAWSLSSARAGEQIWSALILATNEKKPSAPPAELAARARNLERVFGYNQFEIIGDHTQTIDDPTEQWLVPSKLFSLRVSESRTSAGRHRLRVELYQKDRCLVTTEAELNGDNPLLIRGPRYGGGQLIMALVVK